MCGIDLENGGQEQMELYMGPTSTLYCWLGGLLLI